MPKRSKIGDRTAVTCGDEEEDEFIAKIKAAATSGRTLKSSSIRNLVPSILNVHGSPATSQTGHDNVAGDTDAFFSHAVAVLSRKDVQPLPVPLIIDSTNGSEDNSCDESSTQKESATQSETDNETNVTQDGLPKTVDKTDAVVLLDGEECSDIEVISDNETNEREKVDAVILLDDDDPSRPPVIVDESAIVNIPYRTIDNDITIRVKVEDKLEKFSMKMDEKFEHVFKSLSKSLHLSINEFALLRDGVEELVPSATPRQLGMRTIEILEFVQHDVSAPTIGSSSRPQGDNGNVILKFQDGNRKRVVEMRVNKLDSFDIIKNLYVKERGLDGEQSNRLKFVFDGDTITDASTPAELDMDDGDCIDVMC